MSRPIAKVVLLSIRRRALAPLVDAGYVDIVYGGGKEGAFLCNHPLVRSEQHETRPVHFRVRSAVSAISFK